MKRTIRKNNTTLDLYFPSPLSVVGYFAILDQNPSVLSVLQAPVDGNNDSVIMNSSFRAVCLYICRHTCEVFSALFLWSPGRDNGLHQRVPAKSQP